MKRIIGLALGLLWTVLAILAFRHSSAGWAADHSDIGIWWAVVGTFLAIAAAALFVGTIIHTRNRAG